VTKAMALYAATSLLVTVLLAWVLGLVWTSGAEHRAILVSAVVAWVVQLFAFAIARLTARTNSVMIGWGIGALLRFAVLAVYGLVIVRAFGLPSAAALVSLAAIFFLSTLVEPLFFNV
jgi:hypothetical protein